MIAKCSGKSPFSKYLGFQSNALEFSKCQVLGRTCGIIWLKKKRGWEAEFQERIRKEWACPAAWTLPARIQRWPARPRQFKPQKSVTRSWGSLAQLTRRASIFDLKNLWAICLLNIIIYCHCVSNQPSITWSRRSILNFKFWVLTFSRLMSCSMSNDQNCAMWKHFNSIALTCELFILLRSV